MEPILQVVHFSTTTTTTTTSSTFTDTALSASITPTSSSNKIMVHIVANVGWSKNNTDLGQVDFRILRDSTVIDTPNNDMYHKFLYSNFWADCKFWDFTSHNNLFSHLIVQRTTSSVTYKAQIASRDGGSSPILCFRKYYQWNISHNFNGGSSMITKMDAILSLRPGSEFVIHDGVFRLA